MDDLGDGAPASSQLIERLARLALGERSDEALFADWTEALIAAGMPILRASVAFRLLHPLWTAGALVWTAERGTLREFYAHATEPSPAFLASPLAHVLENRLRMLAHRLDGPDGGRFPVYAEFLAQGGVEYVCLSEIFRTDGATGILWSLVAGAPGLTEADRQTLARALPHLALAFKSRIERQIAEALASAYLGPEAGAAVLAGAIRRGDGRRVEAALFLSDLRGSTDLAEALPADAFLAELNRYFEMTAGAVQAEGGQVVSLVGDAVVAMFPAEGGAAGAAAAALAAARRARAAAAGGALDFGIGLHFGEVVHGNIGTPDRLQFTVVGTAVNAAARVQALTKALKLPVLATSAFATLLPGAFRPVGVHRLRGLAEPVGIFAPDPLRPSRPALDPSDPAASDGSWAPDVPRA